MKFSENWLREWVNPAITTEELVAQMTMAGLEVDAVEPVAGDFSNVVVAEIVAIEQHPDADKLRVCQVACGEEEPVQVVCGAPNARLGLKAPFAKVGAVLPGDFAIKKAKLRGVPSFGMLCGASELGMEDQLDGLMELPADAPVGACLRDYLNLNDTVIDVDLTPNRGDCLSLLGLAREVGVLNKADVNTVDIPAVSAAIDTILPVSVEAAEDCPRYVGRVIKGIDISRPTPPWLVEKLRRSGIRSIDAVVDVTNYVLLELGQPMHAFDLAKLDGQIRVRKAQAEEKLTLLDGQEITLKPDALVIADNSKALALAGIMGGEDSGVNENTQDIVLESAFFAPIAIAGRARSYGLHTDSSHRFERGVDYAGQVRAIERATALLLAIVGGEAGPIHEVAAQDLSAAKNVTLHRERLAQVLGLDIERAEVTEILERLGMTVVVSNDRWVCDVPSYRFDISIEADLIEEIARIYGYNRLPTRNLTVPVVFIPRQEAISPLQRLRDQLLGLGYQEAITYSFIEPALQARFCDDKPVDVRNPISADMSVMRTSLLPGLINALQHNVNRQQSRVRLFETGLRFQQQADGISQQKSVAGVIYGSRQAESWANDAGPVDFYDIKGDVESLLQACGKANVQFVAGQHKALHPGQTAVLVEDGEPIGVVGSLHPELVKTLGIAGPAFVFELSLDRILYGNVPNFKALSKFPQVRRDIAVIIDKAVEASRIRSVVRQHAGEWQQECIIFDVYAGQGIEEGKKSLALGITFQHPERSLTDEEIQQAIDAVVAALEKEVSAKLRN